MPSDLGTSTNAKGLNFGVPPSFFFRAREKGRETGSGLFIVDFS